MECKGRELQVLEELRESSDGGDRIGEDYSPMLGVIEEESIQV